MAESRSAASKATVVDAIVLAFAHSEASDLVGTDALRSVLSVEYHDMRTDTGLDLTSLWELLEEQPGFTPEMALPPICLFKSWEDKLGLEVTLPPAASALSAKECALASAQCKVPNAELRKVFDDPATAGSSPDAKKRTARTRRRPVARDADDRKRQLIVIGAAAVALACFVFVGMHIYGSIAGGGHWTSTPPAQITGMEVSKAERFGDQLGVVASTPSWHTQPRQAKENQLRTALSDLQKRGVRVLFVRDQAGQVRATAQLSGKTGQMSFTFR